MTLIDNSKPSTKPALDHVEQHSDDASAHTRIGGAVGIAEKGMQPPTAPAGGDVGAAWLAEYDGARPELTDELNRKVVRKVDRWLMPIIFYIYFCQQLDKSSV